jgi:hypothetical protein
VSPSGDSTAYLQNKGLEPLEACQQHLQLLRGLLLLHPCLSQQQHRHCCQQHQLLDHLFVLL